MNHIENNMERIIHPTRLARSYVPFQYMGEVYEPLEALKKGTLFPELYMPYMDIMKRYYNSNNKNMDNVKVRVEENTQNKQENVNPIIDQLVKDVKSNEYITMGLKNNMKNDMVRNIKNNMNKQEVMPTQNNMNNENLKEVKSKARENMYEKEILTKNQLSMNLAALQFMTVDLALYLNTHPDDKDALTLYNKCVEGVKSTWEKYEEMYGPLTHVISKSKYPWQWIEGDWPWEKQ